MKNAEKMMKEERRKHKHGISHHWDKQQSHKRISNDNIIESLSNEASRKKGDDGYNIVINGHKINSEL